LEVDAVTIGIAVLATLLICAGSFFGIVAPGDGQTGMITFPLWFLGAVLGVWAIRLSLVAGSPRGHRWVVLLLAIIAFASVVWSFVASQQYAARSEGGRRTGSR